MTKFLANWEVETDITLPTETPFLRYDHPSSAYTVFVRNSNETHQDLSFLSMQIVFDAPSIQEAKPIAERLAKEFLDYLSLVSNLKVRLRTLLHLFNWEPGNRADREAFYYTRPQPHYEAPYATLNQQLLDTIALLQSHPIVPRLRRAIKWFASGVASKAPDDQFTFFWLVIELVAQVVKELSSVPDRCPRCKAPLYCPDCQTTPLHRPYAKQAIEQLFMKYVQDDPARFYQQAIEARNMLIHGEEVQAIEASLGIPFSDLVDRLGNLAWLSIINQFAPVIVGKAPLFMQTNMYVYMTMSALAHVKVGFIPRLDNPDPSHFPQIQLTVGPVPQQPPATTTRP